MSYQAEATADVENLYLPPGQQTSTAGGDCLVDKMLSNQSKNHHRAAQLQRIPVGAPTSADKAAC